jgi:hypothetical protein
MVEGNTANYVCELQANTALKSADLLQVTSEV